MRGFLIILALIVGLAVVGWMNAESWIAVACLAAVIFLVTVAIGQISDNLRHQDLSHDPRKTPLDKLPR